MADVANFLLGAVITGAGIVLLATGGHPLALTFLSIGVGLMTTGIFGLPEFQDGIKTNVAGTQAPLPVIYGRTKVGHAAADIRQELNNKDNLHIVGAICVASENGHGIQDIERIWFGDTQAFSSPVFPSNDINGLSTGLDGFWIRDGEALAYYNLHDGSDAQAADAQLLDEFTSDTWPSTSTGKGIAYAALRLLWDDSEERRWGSVPVVTYTVLGNRVFDPRFPTNGPNADGFVFLASDTDVSITHDPGRNPALCLYDYLRSKRYGLALDSTRIDTQSFIDHANYCDEDVTVPDGSGGTTTQARYQVDGALSTADDHKTNIEKLLSAQNANLVWASGKVVLMPRKPQTAETFELTDDNILGQISVARSGTQTPNTIRARFPDKLADYNVTDVVWPEPGTNDFLTADAGWESEHVIDLPLTTDYYMAQHLAMIALRELREDVTISVTATEEALVLQPGHIVNVTYDTAGWVQKEFRVLSMELKEDSTIEFQLREYDNGVYSLDPLNDRPTVPGTNLPNPFVVEPPGDVAITCSIPIETTSGEIIPGVEVTWTHSTDPFAEWEEPVYKEFTAVDWIHTGRRVLMNDDPSAILTGPFEVGKTYHFAVVAYNNLGRASSYAVGPSCQITQPEDPNSPAAGTAIILNCEWVDDGTYWATEVDSTGVATNTTTVSTGVDFVFDNNGETITIVQVVDESTDITKTIDL